MYPPLHLKFEFLEGPFHPLEIPKNYTSSHPPLAVEFARVVAKVHFERRAEAIFRCVEGGGSTLSNTIDKKRLFSQKNCEQLSFTKKTPEITLAIPPTDW